jgi:hypothetical protein
MDAKVDVVSMPVAMSMSMAMSVRTRIVDTVILLFDRLRQESF